MSEEQPKCGGLNEAEREGPFTNWFWLLGLAGVIALLLFALLPPQELYQGKQFSYWLDQLPSTTVTPVHFAQFSPDGKRVVTASGGGVGSWVAYSGGDYETRRQQAAEAAKIVGRVGGKYLPLLVRRLRSKDSPWKMAVLHWAVKFLHIKAAQEHSADVRRGQALTAILKLGYAAKPIFPELGVLAKDKDLQVRASAKYALEQLRPDEFERLERMQNAPNVR